MYLETQWNYEASHVPQIPFYSFKISAPRHIVGRIGWQVISLLLTTDMYTELKQTQEFLTQANAIVLDWHGSQPLHLNDVSMCVTLRGTLQSILCCLDQICNISHTPLGLDTGSSGSELSNEPTESDEDDPDMCNYNSQILLF